MNDNQSAIGSPETGDDQVKWWGKVLGCLILGSSLLLAMWGLVVLERPGTARDAFKEIAIAYRYEVGLGICDMVNADPILVSEAFERVNTPKHKLLRIPPNREWFTKELEKPWEIRYYKGATPDVISEIHLDGKMKARVTIDAVPGVDMRC